jgi:acyl-CoA reductase-like NAD-dependent aldehyde dehydrogenase
VSGTTLNWIDAEWLTAATICPSRNPANNNVVGQFADGGQAKADTAIAATRPAFCTMTWGRRRVLPHRVHTPARLIDRWSE